MKVIKQIIKKKFCLLRIVYKNDKPYGIRDSNGFLFFFVNISRFPGQEERYARELEEQAELANFLLDVLINNRRKG